MEPHGEETIPRALKMRPQILYMYVWVTCKCVFSGVGCLTVAKPRIPAIKSTVKVLGMAVSVHLTTFWSRVKNHEKKWVDF